MRQNQSSSHAKRWFSWMLVALTLFYLIFIYYLERIAFGQWLAALSPNLSGLEAIIILFIRILRHFIPLIVGWWFAYNAAVLTVGLLYDLPDKESAKTFLAWLRSPNIRSKQGFPLNDQTLAEDRAHSVLMRVGGPGKVQVAPSDVAVTEDNGNFNRVLGPGSHLLQPYEYVHAVLDLRQQRRQVTGVTLRTRDNIELTAAFTVVYRLKPGDEPPTKNKPYPYDETAVRKAAYAQTVIGDDILSTWEGKAASTTRSRLAKVVAQFKLDELIHPPGRTDEPYRTLQQEVLRSARNELARSGIELLSIQIEQLKPPAEVEALFIKYWQSQWQTRSRLVEADDRATAVEEMEVARAEAEVAMMQAILEGIQRARRSGATSRTSEVVALRLIEGLERMAEVSRHGEPVLSNLDKMREDLLASTISQADNSPEKTDSS